MHVYFCKNWSSLVVYIARRLYFLTWKSRKSMKFKPKKDNDVINSKVIFLPRWMATMRVSLCARSRHQRASPTTSCPVLSKTATTINLTTVVVLCYTHPHHDLEVMVTPYFLHLRTNDPHLFPWVWRMPQLMMHFALWGQRCPQRSSLSRGLRCLGHSGGFHILRPSRGSSVDDACHGWVILFWPCCSTHCGVIDLDHSSTWFLMHHIIVDEGYKTIPYSPSKQFSTKKWIFLFSTFRFRSSFTLVPTHSWNMDTTSHGMNSSVVSVTVSRNMTDPGKVIS